MPEPDALAEEMLTGGGLAATHTAMTEPEAAQLLARHFGIDGRPTRLATEKDDTFAVRGADGARYVLKVANPSEPVEEVDLQVRLLQHLQATDPALPVPRVIPDQAGDPFVRVDDDAGQRRAISLLTYLPGTPLDRTESSADGRRRIGELLARLRLATTGFAHPGADRTLAWDVRHASRLRPLLAFVDDDRRRRALTAGMDRVDTRQEEVRSLRMQVLHNDFSRSNIIVDHDQPGFVTGIIDFGDTVRTAIAIDVSTALLNQLPREGVTSETPLLSAPGDVLAGYLDTAELTDHELAILPHLVLSRVVVRALISLRRAQLFPHNETYILRNTAQGWDQLDWLLDRSDEDLAAALLAAAS